MRGRKLVYQNIADMCAALRELSFEAHRFQGCLVAIVGSAFGADGERGLMEKRTAYYANTSPLEWAKEVDELYDLLGPSSFLMKKIADCANNQMPIDPVLLPRCITDEFPKSGNYQSRLLSGLRREATGSFSIRLWQWFWIAFLKSFLGLQVEERRPTPEEEVGEDDFFHSIVRNPYLGLLLRTLNHQSGPLKGRLLNLIHLLLVEELLFKFRRREGGEEVPYRLRPHYLHLLYLLILSTDPEEETVKTYYLYLQKVSQNYSATTIMSHNHNIRGLLRVWLTLATRTSSPEVALVRKIALANDKDGWFRLARCPIDKYQLTIAALRIPPRELGRANAAREAILRLLEKAGEWEPTYGMLAVLEQLMTFEQRRRGELAREAEEEGAILVRAIQRVLLALNDQNQRELASSSHQKLSKRIQELYGRGLGLVIGKEAPIKAGTPTFKAGERRLIGGPYPQKTSVWAYPLQQNEFLLLYQLTYWLAEQMERVLPGERSEHPRLNLRILSNPLVFVVTVALIVVLLKVAF